MLCGERGGGEEKGREEEIRARGEVKGRGGGESKVKVGLLYVLPFYPCFHMQILEWDKMPLSSVPFDHVAPMIEQSSLDRVTVVVRSG